MTITYAVYATGLIALCFAVAAGSNFLSGSYWAGTMNVGLTLTNVAWAVLQAGGK